MSQIPFNKAYLAGRELDYIRQAVENWHISGDGPFTKKCHEFLERELKTRKALLTSSCTDALEMTGLLLNLQPDDEVIVPSYAFVSTVNAYALRGARPVFCDVRKDTLNIDENIIESLVTPRTKAIIALHYAGVSCEMDSILAIAQRRGLQVIEDNAHGLFANYKGRRLGTLGCMSTQSFHETKNFSCGEGGALLINDESLIERALIVREKGTDRNRFYRGLVDKYTWVDVGSSFLPSDILAAYLWAQFEAWQDIQSRRKAIWTYYWKALSPWVKDFEIGLPQVPGECEQPYHMFYLILPSFEYRQDLIANLRRQDIHCVFHYQPLHLSPMGRKFGGKEGDCPVTEDLSNRILRLPFFNDIQETEQSRVVDAISRYCRERAR
jgi:dTDP-4-amino-4,6-dideoxygalactose transaminase